MIKQSKLLSKVFTFVLFVAASMLVLSCDSGEANGDGKFVLNVTDAPVDDEKVTGVYITFTGIEYQIEGDGWQTPEGFGDPVTINLLELQNGTSSLLGEFNGGAGKYTGLRFQLDAATKDGAVSSNSGCYITFEDGSETGLFVPSGGQSGYKAVGNFTVPVNGTVEVTADFDLRKSVTKAGSTGKYILKPTIRVIVNNQAGEISGTIANAVQDSSYVVYAYDAGSYDTIESNDPAEGETRFPNAVSSTSADENGNYVLAFIAEGNYDVVFTTVDAEGNVTVNGIVEGATVESNTTTQVDFAL